MGLFDGLSEELKPHVNNLAQVAGQHLYAIRDGINRLVELGDLGRPDIDDVYQRFSPKGEFAGGTKFELGTCLPGEIWLVQSLVSNGIENSSPHFVIRANNYLIASVIKEGIGSETQGGDIVILPGEQLTWESPNEAGHFEFCLLIIRRQKKMRKITANLGPRAENLAGHNTHEAGRDEIPNQPGTHWPNTPQEVKNLRGNPPITATPPPFNPGIDPTGVRVYH